MPKKNTVAIYVKNKDQKINYIVAVHTKNKKRNTFVGFEDKKTAERYLHENPSAFARTVRSYKKKIRSVS